MSLIKILKSGTKSQINSALASDYNVEEREKGCNSNLLHTCVALELNEALKSVLQKVINQKKNEMFEKDENNDVP